jgi:hypothetical protein
LCGFSVLVQDDVEPPALATRHSAASVPTEVWEQKNMAVEIWQSR